MKFLLMLIIWMSSLCLASEQSDDSRKGKEKIVLPAVQQESFDITLVPAKPSQGHLVQYHQRNEGPTAFSVIEFDENSPKTSSQKAKECADPASDAPSMSTKQKRLSGMYALDLSGVKNPTKASDEHEGLTEEALLCVLGHDHMLHCIKPIVSKKVQLLLLSPQLSPAESQALDSLRHVSANRKKAGEVSRGPGNSDSSPKTVPEGVQKIVTEAIKDFIDQQTSQHEATKKTASTHKKWLGGAAGVAATIAAGLLTAWLQCKT